MLDSVQQARCVSVHEANEIRNKLLNLTSQRGRSRFSHMIMPLPGNVRGVGQIGEYIEIMLEAMYLHKKIQFQYTEINNAMPERLLNKRGHFVERKDEPKFEREIRYTQWSENRHLIDTWMKYYSMFEKDTVLEYIGCNRFSVETLDKIENEELKKLYFLYLTPSATIRVFSDCTEDTKRIISTFILEELPFMYSRIVETILSSKPGYKVIAGILENFGEKVCTDLLKKIDLFSGHDNDKLTMLIKANKSKRLVDFDFSLLQFIPYFHVSNLLSKQEEQIIMNSAYELKEAPIRKILLLHLDELKDVLIKTNGAQPGDTQIISVIEEQIKELYHQISIFEL